MARTLDKRTSRRRTSASQTSAVPISGAHTYSKRALPVRDSTVPSLTQPIFVESA